MDKLWPLIWFFSACLTAGGAGHPPRVDLIFAVDKSSSIGNTNLALGFDFIHKLLDHFSISSSTTRVSLITYSSKVNTEFNFTSHLNRECLYSTLKKLKIRSVKSTAATNLALKSARAIYKNLSLPFSKKILILLTNGHSDKLSLLRRHVKQLKLDRVEIIVIGIGNGLNKHILKDIASFPLVRHLFYLKKKSHIDALISLLFGRTVAYTQCTTKGKRKVYDECKRECQCINGSYANCYRIRKEFTTFTSEERIRYLRNYKILTTKEPFKSKYLKFIHKHYFYFWKGIHTVKQFFPWHRWYIWGFENLLRELDCRITAPFWDWSFWANVAWDVGKHIWKDNFAGIGGNGDPQRDFCVQMGLFRENIWTTPSYEDSKLIVNTSLSDDAGKYPKNFIKHDKHPFCLRRKFNGVPYSLKRVKRALKLKASQFKDFELEVRGNYHDTLHCEIGGQMCTDFAADSPEFFFHHGILDNIWYRWQQKSKDRKYVYFKGKTFTMLACIYTPEHFIDAHQLPMCTRVKYQDFVTGRTPPKKSDNMKKYKTKNGHFKTIVGKDDNYDNPCEDVDDEDEMKETNNDDTPDEVNTLQNEGKERDEDEDEDEYEEDEQEENENPWIDNSIDYEDETRETNNHDTPERHDSDIRLGYESDEEINREAIDKARKLFPHNKEELIRLEYLNKQLGNDRAENSRGISDMTDSDLFISD